MFRAEFVHFELEFEQFCWRNYAVIDGELRQLPMAFPPSNIQSEGIDAEEQLGLLLDQWIPLLQCSPTIILDIAYAFCFKICLRKTGLKPTSCLKKPPAKA